MQKGFHLACNVAIVRFRPTEVRLCEVKGRMTGCLIGVSWDSGLKVCLHNSSELRMTFLQSGHQ